MSAITRNTLRTSRRRLRNRHNNIHSNGRINGRRSSSLAFGLILSLAAITFALPASAELYKWIDDDGKVHFTDKPISPNAETIEIQQQKKIGQDDAVRGINERVKRLRQSESEAQAVEDKLQAKKQARKDQVKRQCGNNKYKLSRLNGLVFRVNEDGERVYMTDDEILEKRATLQKWIDENC